MIRHHIIFLSFAAAACVTSCQKEQTAMTAAQHYYECLLDSQYGEWIDGTVYSEHFTPQIRQERIDMLRQYMHDEQVAHGGIQKATAIRDTTVEDNAFVFIQLQYGDSTSEEILMPMVRIDKTWKMK